MLHDCTVLSLCNLLSSNIDVGLKFALNVGYDEDTKIRTALMNVLKNILQHGLDFDDHIQATADDRYLKLVRFLFEPDLSITFALCDCCPVEDMDEVALMLLNIFNACKLDILLLKSMIDREVQRTGLIILAQSLSLPGLN